MTDFYLLAIKASDLYTLTVLSQTETGNIVARCIPYNRDMLARFSRYFGGSLIQVDVPDCYMSELKQAYAIERNTFLVSSVGNDIISSLDACIGRYQ